MGDLRDDDGPTFDVLLDEDEAAADRFCGYEPSSGTFLPIAEDFSS